MEKFSVLMSVYHRDNAVYLKEALNSIFDQSILPTEIILVKDGLLSQELNSVIDYFVEKYSSVKIVELLDNQGLGRALNEGLKYCSCDLIARMDADDISMPERFVKQIAFMNSHPDIDCLGTWAIEIDDDGKEYFRKKMPITHEECLELFKKRDCMIHPTVMFRRSYFEKAGLYPEDTYFGEDTMMWAKGFKSGCKFANVPEYLFKFRLDSNFFERRRGWKHAKSIYTLRHRVNRMLGFGWKEDCYALLYAMAKLMPKSILDIIYKTVR